MCIASGGIWQKLGEHVCRVVEAVWPHSPLLEFYLAQLFAHGRSRGTLKIPTPTTIRVRDTSTSGIPSATAENIDSQVQKLGRQRRRESTLEACGQGREGCR